MKKCPICDSFGVKRVFKNYPGYIDGLSFDIYCCSCCNTSFIDPLEVKTEYYNWIYSNPDIPGYDRYYSYMKKIKATTEPLKYLSEHDQYYYPVFQYLSMNCKTNLDILDIGCGYGYLTYSMKKLGHNVCGIDVSSRAIEVAKKQFGNFFENATVEQYFEKTKKRFDLITAVEVIEHLIDPNKFLQYCIKLLKDKGQIIITTPNKLYNKKSSIWISDIPPIHAFWYSKSGITALARKFGLKPSFFSYSHYFTPNQNELFNYYYYKLKNEVLPVPILDKDGKLIKSHLRNPSFFGKLINSNMLFRLKIIRRILAAVYGNHERVVLAAVLTK